jgi:hypothetical protein
MHGDLSATRWLNEADLKKASREPDALLEKKFKLENPLTDTNNPSNAADKKTKKQLDKAQQEADRAKKESQSIIDRLQREKDVLVFGEDAMSMWEDMAKANSIFEREQIEQLYKERAEREKDAIDKREAELIRQAGEDAESKRIDQLLARADREREKKKEIEEALRKSPGENYAVESRLLTRGTEQDKVQQEIAGATKGTVSELKKIDERLKNNNAQPAQLKVEMVA